MEMLAEAYSSYPQRFMADRSAAPAAAAPAIAGMTTVLSAASQIQRPGLSRLCGWNEIFPTDRSARTQSMV
jgi:hypothetical protein